MGLGEEMSSTRVASVMPAVNEMYRSGEKSLRDT